VNVEDLWNKNLQKKIKILRKNSHVTLIAQVRGKNDLFYNAVSCYKDIAFFMVDK
jgi:hypothetical protein